MRNLDVSQESLGTSQGYMGNFHEAEGEVLVARYMQGCHPLRGDM